MANKEELTTMIKCFRINELQMLLSYAGRSKYGKKQKLQSRALSLLNLQSEPLALKIRHLYQLMQKCYSNFVQYPSPERFASPSSASTWENSDNGSHEKEDDSIAILDAVPINTKNSYSDRRKSHGGSKTNPEACSQESASSLQLTMNPLYYPVHPNVKFKKLPFYKMLHELLKPASLVAEGYHIRQKHSFVFYLTHEQSKAFHPEYSIKRGSHQTGMVQGQLRLALLETTSKQIDCHPDGLMVVVNNKYCSIEELPKRKKKDIYYREPSLPINITPFIKTNPMEENKVDIFWNSNFSSAYVVGVYIVMKKSSEELLSRLKGKSIRGSDYTRAMIKEKLREEADSEIVTTSLRVSLSCPLGKVRIQMPCRASTCQHFQCFDASLYLQMNDRKPAWICPVCDKRAEYDALFIDGYFIDILNSEALSSDVNEIELHSDGSWSSMEIKTENCSNDGTPTVKAEPELDIVEVFIEDSPSPLEEKNSNLDNEAEKPSSTNLEKRKVDEIDLTVSDSDDEPLIYYKRRESLKNKHSATSSPSVIQLDLTDSSNDSLAVVVSNSVSASSTPTGGIQAEISSSSDIMARVEDPGGTPKAEESMIPWFAESGVFF